ncbi:MAG TPA: ATP-binding protein, partial [Xanthomonadales bacterium]|nr:ATP-binding protein [Xanthomonadales bacterium]
AIGVYWADRHPPGAEALKLLQALADSTAIALDNLHHTTSLEQRARDRSAELIEANRELEGFTATVAHDLRAPLRHIAGFARILTEDHAGALDAAAQQHLSRIVAGATRMSQLLEALLAMSHTTQTMVMRQPLDLTALATDLVASMKRADPTRKVDVAIAGGLTAYADSRLLRAALECLLSNAWKFTAGRGDATIEIGSRVANDRTEFYVRDNGVGFDMAHADRLFGAFQRLHSEAEFPGLGTGLATVRRIVHKHRGEVWAEGKVGQGAAVYFWLPGREQIELGLHGERGSSAMH